MRFEIAAGPLQELLPAAVLPCHAELEEEIPLGIEVVTGFRSDYVYRGLSQSREDPAVQGGFNYQHDRGFFAGRGVATEVRDERIFYILLAATLPFILFAMASGSLSASGTNTFCMAKAVELDARKANLPLIL